MLSVRLKSLVANVSSLVKGRLKSPVWFHLNEFHFGLWLGHLQSAGAGLTGEYCFVSCRSDLLLHAPKSKSAWLFLCTRGKAKWENTRGVRERLETHQISNWLNLDARWKRTGFKLAQQLKEEGQKVKGKLRRRSAWRSLTPKSARLNDVWTLCSHFHDGLRVLTQTPYE